MSECPNSPDGHHQMTDITMPFLMARVQNMDYERERTKRIDNRSSLSSYYRNGKTRANKCPRK